MPQVLDVYTGQNGLLSSGSHLRPWLFIDSSTIDPQTSRVLSNKISKYLLKEKKGFYPIQLLDFLCRLHLSFILVCRKSSSSRAFVLAVLIMYWFNFSIDYMA